MPLKTLSENCFDFSKDTKTASPPSQQDELGESRLSPFLERLHPIEQVREQLLPDQTRRQDEEASIRSQKGSCWDLLQTEAPFAPHLMNLLQT
jgi:hypothetical protein